MTCCIEKSSILPPLLENAFIKFPVFSIILIKKHELFLQKNHRSYYNRNITFRRLLER